MEPYSRILDENHNDILKRLGQSSYTVADLCDLSVRCAFPLNDCCPETCPMMSELSEELAKELIATGYTTEKYKDALDLIRILEL